MRWPLKAYLAIEKLAVMADGAGEAESAEVLRDLSESAWGQLTEDERRWLNTASDAPAAESVRIEWDYRPKPGVIASAGSDDDATTRDSST